MKYIVMTAFLLTDEGDTLESKSYEHPTEPEESEVE